MKARWIRPLLATMVTLLALPGLGGANHFNGSPDGTFQPQLTVSADAPVQNQTSNLTLTVTQADHEDPTRILYLRIPSGWQIATDQVRPAQYADGSQDNYDCGAALAPAAAGLRSVARAEIIGKMSLAATSDVTQPRTTPIVWNGDVYWLSWDAPAPLGLSLTTGVDGTGDTFIDATWTADPAATSYDLRMKQTGEAYTTVTTSATTHHFGGLISGNEYNVGVRVAGGSYMTDLTITAGTGTVRPSGRLCALITTGDSRIQNLYDTTKGTPGEVDLRQLDFGFPFRRLADGRWEVFADITDLAGDGDLQTAQASALSLSVTMFGATKGNWQLDPADPTKKAPLQGFVKNPALEFSAAPLNSPQAFEGVFHPCHQHTGGAAQPCGANGQSTQPDVTRTSVIKIYPGHAKPYVTAPKPSEVILGSNTVTIAWVPHPWSDPASDTVSGLKGWIVRVTPYSKANDNSECPEAIYCRGAANPILVNENGNGVTSDANGGTSVAVSVPSDGWYAFRITAVYKDGHTSHDTELASVRGYSGGQFFAATTQWPFVYMDTRTRSTLKNNSNPVLLFIDPEAQKFSLVQLGRTLADTEPGMIFAPDPSVPGDGTGAFSHTIWTGNMTSSWNVTMEFTPEAAKGIWLYNGTTAGGNFDGARVR